MDSSITKTPVMKQSFDHSKEYDVAGLSLDDGKCGVKKHVYEVGNARGINLVVDLSRCCVVDSSVKNASDVVEVIENDGGYEFKDLVWGKVKNYLWWPGQIIDPSVLSDKAMKELKKDGFLIAYFGDKTFAFNELRNIKHFRVNFCEMESQSRDEGFVQAVNDALCEAARRVEFGLTCLCLSEEVCGEVKSQIVVNSGIRKEYSRIDGGARFSTLNSFIPAKTVDFLQNLAKDPLGMNRLGVLTVRGQLSAFNRWKGYHQLQVNQVLYELDNISDVNHVTNSALHLKGTPKARGRSRTCKQQFNGGLSPSKKVRSLSDLMSTSNESVSDVEYKPKKRSRKRKAIESNVSVERSQSESQTQTEGEFLLQIYVAARNPIEGQHNLDSLVEFFSDFKNYRLRKDKNDEEIANQPKTDEPDKFTGAKDSYLTVMTTVTESETSPKPNKENSATALTFKFTNLDSVPSVKKLHEIFRRYGALQETETRVLKKKKCVRLVFERKCDAEAAFSSSGKFSIFGPALVSYRLNFFPKLQKQVQLS